jgi:hypothetical protein
VRRLDLSWIHRNRGAELTLDAETASLLDLRRSASRSVEACSTSLPACCAERGFCRRWPCFRGSGPRRS